MNYQIRELQLQDLSNESFFQTLSALRAVKDLTPALAEEIFKGCKAKGIETYVLVDDKKIVGTIRFLFEAKFYHQGRLAAHIEDVAVHSDYQGKGIGKTLIQFAIKHCQERNCYKIILDCNDSLLEFYQKQGFVQHENCLRYNL
ncbi:MAG: GNAT family N-acetyltransferase [Patescibacteria group bacterium]|nr:GNAT family N-acetyltransferase [Patescibacteria group bacterium]